MFRVSLTLLLALLVLAGVVAVWASTAPSRPLPLPLLDRDAGTPDMRVSLSKRRLNQQMAASLRNDPTIQDPALDLLPPDGMRVFSTLHIQLLGRELAIRPSLLFRLGVENGRAFATPEGVDVGGIPVPDLLVNAPMEQAAAGVEDQINGSVAQVKQGTGLTLQAISVDRDNLILDFGEAP